MSKSHGSKTDVKKGEAEKLITAQNDRQSQQLQEPEVKRKSTELRILLCCPRRREYYRVPQQNQYCMALVGCDGLKVKLVEGAANVALHGWRRTPSTLRLENVARNPSMGSQGSQHPKE